MTITFHVQGTPKGQPRARAFAQRFGNKYSARMYDPGTADEWKRDVHLGLRTALRTFGDQPSLGAFSVELNFLLPRPKSHYGKLGVKKSAPDDHCSKPDIDNLAKLVLDVITKDGRVWRDDSQVMCLLLTKSYALCFQQPGVKIRIQSRDETLAKGNKLREEPPEV